LELRNVGGRKAADGGNDEAGRIHLALVGAHGPAIGLFIEHGLDNPLAELDVGLEVEALGAMLEIAQDLVLLRIAFGPLPLWREVRVEGGAIDVTMGVATRTGIAVPVPGPADAMARLDRLDLQAEAVAQRLDHVHAGEAGADHHGIELDDSIRVV